MAENDQNNDEYRFVELDGLDNDMMGDGDQTPAKSQTSARVDTGEQRPDIKRNAIIAVIVIICLMFIYKLFTYFFTTSTKEVAKIESLSVAKLAPIEPVATTPEPTPITAFPVQSTASTDVTELTRKVSTIELTEQNVRNEVGSITQQVANVNNNINNVNTQLANLNQVINNLSAQLAKQNDQINLLMAKAAPKQIVKRPAKVSSPQVNYMLQAVIPGRAWLIATNGSTLTVREGSKIPGYGLVKLIDSVQGRVLTSSGQVIGFSQDDS